MKSAAEARFQKDNSCPITQVEELSERRFRVRGCGIAATYTCVLEGASSGGWSGGGTGAPVCIPEGAPVSGADPSVGAPRLVGSVARLMDEKTRARGVKAEFPLLQRGAVGPWLRLQAWPALAPNHVWLTLVGTGKQLPSDSCRALTLLVNGVPLRAAAKFSFASGADMLDATYVASAFTPLNQPNPTLAVTACTATFQLPSEELANAQKFLAIREELGAQPKAAPSGPSH